MKEQIKKLKEYVSQESENPNFIHYNWFKDYHLNIVEKIALELCERYPEADKNIVKTMVWFHDYGQIIDIKNQYNLTSTKGREMLLNLGFEESFVDKIVEYTIIFDKKKELGKAPIEIQIISSADAASHLIGPFFRIWWKQNSQKSIEDLMVDNRQKALIDWDKKVTLPEIRKRFQDRHNQLLEQTGNMPEKFLDG